MTIVLVTVDRSPMATGVELVLASQPPPTGLTTHENVAEPVLPPASVTVAVTVEVPAVVGVPEMAPEEDADRPAGRPETDHEYGAVPPVAASCSDAGEPTVELWLPGFVTEGLPGCGSPKSE